MTRMTLGVHLFLAGLALALYVVILCLWQLFGPDSFYRADASVEFSLTGMVFVGGYIGLAYLMCNGSSRNRYL